MLDWTPLLRAVEEAAYRGVSRALRETAPAEGPEELDSAQAAALLRFPSPAALNRWADRHPAAALPRHAKGRGWTFRRSELLTWWRRPEIARALRRLPPD